MANALIPNLDNYRSGEPTDSCYLDGRYFNKVFEQYPGLVKNPLNVYVEAIDEPNVKSLKIEADMTRTQLDPNYYGLVRVIIESEIARGNQIIDERHCGLLLIDHTAGKIYWLDPANYPYKAKIHLYLANYLGNFLDDYVVVPVDIDIERLAENPNCAISGYCTAYAIKYAYDVILGRVPQFDNILSFAGEIEDMYGPLDQTNPDIAYGLFGGPNGGLSRGQGALLGGLGGAAVGSLAGGGVGGTLLGGALGAGAGYALF